MDGGKRRVDSQFADAVDPKDKDVIDQIMLRYRPIAPRPVTAEVSGQKVPANDVVGKRVKRKYVRVKKRKCNSTKNDNKGLLDFDRTVALFEVCDGKELVVPDPAGKLPNWISFDISGNKKNDIIGNLFTPAPPLRLSPPDLHDLDLPAAGQRRKVVESWITMECVTGTCEDGRPLGYTDEEKWKNLERDSCPGFISNGCDEVQWVNLAFRRMVDACSGAPPPEVVVWLGLNVEKSTVVNYWPAFSCRVRVVYRLSEKKTQMTVPCDVWKMDFGGFAWRLDIEAALSLGPLNLIDQNQYLQAGNLINRKTYI